MNRLLATLALLAAAGAAQANTGRLVDVRLHDTTDDRELPVFRDGGRSYVPGTPGNRYSIVLQNRSGERVMAVLSVDGVNAISGQTAGAQQSGYVLGPWERAEIRGWRKDLRESADFYFTELPDSYAARTGRPDNVGVIGVAVFRERVLHRPPPAIAQEAPAPWRDRNEAKSESEAARSADSVAGAKSQAPAAPAQELGTGHGERRWDPVGTTTFERRSSRPDEVVSLFYDAVPVLVARGIMPPPWRHRRHREPDPFPVGFVPDPWR